MKKMMMPAIAAVLLVVGRAGAESPAEALTRGKLETDQGRPKAAVAAFAAVLEDQAASAEQRWEALIRLGVARREAGDLPGSVNAFEEAWRTYGRDPAALRLLLEAVGSALPGPQRWEEVRSKVSLEFDRTLPAKPQIRVLWPGVPPQQRSAPSRMHTISFDFVDANILDIFRIIADVSGENVVVNPGVKGSVTIRVKDAPWDEVLERILAPNGLIARHTGNVVWIGRPEHAPERVTFAGPPAELDYRDADLVQVLREVAGHGGCTVQVAEGVAGRVYLRLAAVPWDQAFDVIVNVNGLTWTRSGNVLRVERRQRPPAH